MATKIIILMMCSVNVSLIIRQIMNLKQEIKSCFYRKRFSLEC